MSIDQNEQITIAEAERNLAYAEKEYEKACSDIATAPKTITRKELADLQRFQVYKLDVYKGQQEILDALRDAQEIKPEPIAPAPLNSDEEWRPVAEKGFEDLFLISNKGRIRQRNTGTIYAQTVKGGVLEVCLWRKKYPNTKWIKVYLELMAVFGLSEALSLKITKLAILAHIKHPKAKKPPRPKKPSQPKQQSQPKILDLWPKEKASNSQPVKSAKGGKPISAREKAFIRRLEREGNPTRQIAIMTGRGERQIRRITRGR